MLISESYARQLNKAHDGDKSWGTTSVRFAPILSELINFHKVKTAVDYGCGKGRLSDALDLDHQMALYRYDPGIVGLSKLPPPCDMVICIDVLEHVEPDCIGAVMADLSRLTKKLAFLHISTVPAIKHLPDGRNAHILIKGHRWWIPKMLEYFDIQSVSVDSLSVTAVCLPMRPANGHNHV